MQILKRLGAFIAQVRARQWFAIASTITAIGATIIIPMAVQNSQKRVKYVEIAVRVLEQKPVPETVAIREWAINVMDEYSDVKIDEKMKEALRNYPIFGEIVGTLQQTLGDAKVKAEGTVRDVK